MYVIINNTSAKKEDKKMADYWYNLEIAILMQDQCTKQEAIKYVASDTVIVPVEEWDEFVAQYDEEIKYDHHYESIEEYHKEYSVENIKAGKLADHSYVEFEGKAYIIEYVL